MTLARFLDCVAQTDPVLEFGHVQSVAGMLVESLGPKVALNDFCEILTSAGKKIRTQVAGFRNGLVLSIPLEETDGLKIGDRVVARSAAAELSISDQLLGRVVDGFGLPLDGGPPVRSAQTYRLESQPLGPMERVPISERLTTGIRVIDGLLPCGRGQRVGIFGGSGVGKSTLLGNMCRNNDADVCVIALIGERNREVKEFIENELGSHGLQRSVVICATSDRPAPLRIRAAFVALAAAEYFRDQGKSVLLVIDSVTRLAMAQREIGLAAGEPPGQKGYPPSVFNLLPKIFERAGNFPGGSITGFFTVLVEGDDFNEPVCDTVRGILDGHIVLSRHLGAAGHFPAIDVLQSVSRLTGKLASPEEKKSMQKVRQAMADFARAEDLINLGAYVNGSNPGLDLAIRARPQMLNFLRQASEETTPPSETSAILAELAQQLP
jgi:flagellum-specific ATP synthase